MNMTTLRDYLATIENTALGEGVFGRKLPPPPAPTVDPAKQRRLARARVMQYRNADEYARDNNPRQARNVDPSHLKAASDQEHADLKSEWDRWNRLGYFR